MAAHARDELAGLADRPGYEIWAEVDAGAWTVSGRQRVVYTNRRDSALDELFFCLYANAAPFGGDMQVRDVTAAGQPAEVTYERERTALRVPLPAPLAPGAQTQIEMAFSVRVPQLDENRFGVLVYSKGILSLAGWYPALAVLDDAGWHLDVPAEQIGEAMYAESALYTVHLTMPQDLIVAATGVQVEERADGEGRRTLTYRSGPSRTFYLSAAGYETNEEQAGETVVRSYYLPGHEACGRWVLEAAVAALDLYGGLYGPYPLAEFDVAEADQWYQGMEWPGMMLLGTMFYDGSDPVCGEWFVAHEVAHQWWYNVVGNDPVAHPWLDEALAQYSAMLYYRRLWPADAAEAYIQPIIYDRYAPYAGRPQGVYLDQPTTAFEDRESYYAITYARGAMFFEAVHRALGEEAFFEALRRYGRQNRFAIAAPEDLRAALSEADPALVNELWAEWVSAP
jgi:hypothetical protein